MNRDAGPSPADELWSRRRQWRHLGVTLVGVVLVALASPNIVAPVVTDLEAIAPYRRVFATLLIPPITPPLLPDPVVLAAGLLLLWWR
jgi:hypothetical protein